MASFSSMACCSALSSCSKEDILSAYARMVAFLVQKKKYHKCEAEELTIDFEKMYGFTIPFHPMRTIMDQCTQLGYLTYNSSLHVFFPNYERIDSDDYSSILQAKDKEYQALLKRFGEFLIEQHNLYSSQEDLDDRIRAFIERYGIKAKTDREILRKVKDDYFFAEFLVSCEENGHTEVLDYLDEYTTGVALSEIFTYSETPKSFTAKGACAYLDTGLLFKLFGVDSSNHASSYTQYIRNMQRIGISVMVYEHTLNEMIGIIENSKHWIGNPDYDANLSSEATYFFVSNNWTIEAVNELSASIRTRLEDDLNIKIDRMAYPKTEDIHTTHEADIREMIVDLYKENDPGLDVDAIGYTIDLDARSIFYTLHKNGNKVAYHINDVENVFITTNRTLAKVGYKLSYSIAQSKDVFIPVVMNDIKWGTLIWFNSPALISSINRPRLVSAAYAAFRPDPELTRKLNERLVALEKEGKVTPAQCYLLKVDPIAQHLLARKTMNDPDRFIDSTPLEILKELGREAFEQGIASRQAEVDKLTEESETYKAQLTIEKQARIVSDLEQKWSNINVQIRYIRGREENIKKELDDLHNVKAGIDEIVKRNRIALKVTVSFLAFLLVALSVFIGVNYSPILGVITFVVPIILWIISLWTGCKVSYSLIDQKIEQHTRQKQYNIRRYSDSYVSNLEKEMGSISNQLRNLENKANEVSAQLNIEQGKLVNTPATEKQAEIAMP